MHSTATTRSSRKALTAARNACGLHSRLRDKQHLAGRVQDAQVHLPGVQVDAAVVLVLPGIESHLRPPFRLVSCHMTPLGW